LILIQNLPKCLKFIKTPDDKGETPMQFFLDTANADDIKDLMATGLVDGVTTNPSLVAQSGAKDFINLIEIICSLTTGPVSAEVAATDYYTMQAEADKLANIAPNVVVKLPLTEAGLRVCRNLSQRGVKTNVTLCFSAAQGLLAAKAGATYVSPFVGRLDDVGQDGMMLIAEMMQIFDQYPDLRTQVLVASIRHPQHVVQAAKLGAHVATMPAKIMRQLFNHPLTDKGLAAFVADWAKTGQKIL
jgi:transaldolase